MYVGQEVHWCGTRRLNDHSRSNVQRWSFKIFSMEGGRERERKRERKRDREREKEGE